MSDKNYYSLQELVQIKDTQARTTKIVEEDLKSAEAFYKLCRELNTTCKKYYDTVKVYSRALFGAETSEQIQKVHTKYGNKLVQLEKHRKYLEEKIAQADHSGVLETKPASMVSKEESRDLVTDAVGKVESLLEEVKKSAQSTVVEKTDNAQ